ncbi:MAG: hypothetical protein ACT4OY_08225 [Alphaproteobacteria bacterium]
MNCDCIDTKHKLWWLWLPVLFVAGEFLFERIAPPESVRYAVSENGLIELLEFMIAALGFVFGLITFLRFDFKSQALLKIWIGLGTLGCFYIAGEEISWGQWFLGWTTPETWMAVNDQGETNLHNTSSWLDQKPRIILEIGVVIGGLILPFLIRWKVVAIPVWLQTLTPPSRLGVVAALYIGVRITDWLGELAGSAPYERSSEIFECLMFYFVLLYILHIKERYTRA